MEEAVNGAEAVFIVSPSSAMREIASALKSYVNEDTLLIHATKGFESGTLKRMSEVLKDELQCMTQIGSLYCPGRAMRKK